MPRYWLRWQMASALPDGQSSVVIFPFGKSGRTVRRHAAAPNGTNKDWPQP